MKDNPCRCEELKPREGIRITVELYELLLENSKWLGYLEAAGVDNWEGIHYAYELKEDDSV